MADWRLRRAPDLLFFRRCRQPPHDLLHHVGLHVAIEQRFLTLFGQHLIVVERVVALDQEITRRADVLALFVDDPIGELVFEAELAHRSAAVERQNGLAAALSVGLQHRLGVVTPVDDARLGPRAQIALELRAEGVVVRKVNVERLPRQIGTAPEMKPAPTNGYGET